jgi:hypothetical protein
MDETTQQNAALVEEAAAAAEPLQEQSNALLDAVAKFQLEARVSGGVPDAAPGAFVERRGPNRAKNVTRLPATRNPQPEVRRGPGEIRIRGLPKIPILRQSPTP